MQKFRRTKYGVMVTSAALVALGLTTGMASYKSVDVVVDGHVLQEGTYAGETVAQFLAQEGIHITDYDLVEPARATLLQNGMKIVVRKAKQVVFRDGANPPVTMHTLANTVREFLAQAHVRLGPNDKLNVPLDEKIKPGMDIVVTKLQTVVETQKEVIPYVVERRSSSQYPAGDDVVVRTGENGMALITTQRHYINGKLVYTRQTKKVLQRPINEIIDVGTAPQAPVMSRSDASLVANEVLTVVATAYANPGGYTATGAPAGYGDVAVDPSVIPLGTKLYIPGYGFAVANDTGSAIQGYRIDLCFNSVPQAIDFGRQMVKVYILGSSS
ncbi:3D domain-containing protein [Sulfoacidibacillus thermotolerans]|uniref:G5 domain-containing protein n=1 Tax=Sulfoacidibacillus thermotolerans TaxID=1765684 RepID=A0A2U3DC24_SULT2|nr:3D domain-containing protein [Sulfoacidibacillus thermotolerans]PWI58831.1 hypothetical protein BM613_01700 [Sulfoacidibacillus thermotolerans]